MYALAISHSGHRGARGIGAAIAERVAAAGHDVVIGYHSSPTAAEAVAERVIALGQRALTARVDITDAAQLDEFFQGQSVAGAAKGSCRFSRGSAGSRDAGRAGAREDSTGCGSQPAGAGAHCPRSEPVPCQERGRLGFIGSAAATIGSPGTYVHYAAAKAGTAALAVGLSKELAGSGIRVNCVEPGTVWTEFHQDPQRPAKAAEAIPMGRAADPVEIAVAVNWLLSDEASYTSGATLRVAGGL